MPFICKKKVKGHEYYQWVRNYREVGKVKQEILFHLGRYASPEDRMKYEEEQAAYYEEQSSANSVVAELLKAKILDERDARGDFGYVELLYDHDTDAIPPEWAAHWGVYLLSSYRGFLRKYKERYFSWYDYEKWEEQQELRGRSYVTYHEKEYLGYHHYYEHGDYDLWEEECQAEIDFLNNIVEYHKARIRVLQHTRKASDHRSKLHKLLDLRRKYPGK